jgi:hypothetical protein
MVRDCRASSSRGSPNITIVIIATKATTYPLAQALPPEEAPVGSSAGQHGASPATVPPPLVAAITIILCALRRNHRVSFAAMGCCRMAASR